MLFRVKIMPKCYMYSLESKKHTYLGLIFARNCIIIREMNPVVE